MRAQYKGLIINISSMVTRMHIPGLAGYAATKSALNMLSDAACIELADESIHVITVYPRMTATDFARNSLGNQGTRRRLRSDTAIPVGTADHVAGRILDAAVNEPDEVCMT